MRRITIPIFALTLSVLSGCTTLDQGINAYTEGQYQTAFNHFTACAGEGDADCMNWIGVMYLRGQIQSPDPRAAAVHWYTLAARHGSTHARMNLAALGEAVPHPDLVPVPAQMSPETVEALGAIGGAIGQAIGSGL